MSLALAGGRRPGGRTVSVPTWERPRGARRGLTGPPQSSAVSGGRRPPAGARMSSGLPRAGGARAWVNALPLAPQTSSPGPGCPSHPSLPTSATGTDTGTDTVTGTVGGRVRVALSSLCPGCALNLGRASCLPSWGPRRGPPGGSTLAPETPRPFPADLYPPLNPRPHPEPGASDEHTGGSQAELRGAGPNSSFNTSGSGARGRCPGCSSYTQG